MLFQISDNSERKSPQAASFASLLGAFNLYFLVLMISKGRGFGGSSKTPSSNTGLNSQKCPSNFIVRLDWLTFRLIFTSMEQLQGVVDRLDELFDDRATLDFDIPGFNGRRFDFQGRSVRGALYHCDFPTDTAPGVCLLTLPGSLLKLASMASIHELCQWLVSDYAAVVNRLDIALDDMEKGLQLSDIHKAADLENYAHVQSAEYHKRRKSRGAPWGSSLVFGSPQSDKRVIFYDKEIESDGEIAAIRMEVRFRRDKATYVLNEFCSLELSEVAKTLVNTVTGAVDFLDRSSQEKNLERLQRLPFWQVYLHRVYSCPVKVPSKKREISLEKSLNWLEYGVSPTILLLRKSIGIAGFSDKLNNFLDDAEKRLTKRHHKIIEVYKRDLEHKDIRELLKIPSFQPVI